ncbi:PTS sugar transporter [Sphingobacterium sp. SG20118]|uniref:PTS sugar transporter n=1 Tax=Sphingobacterium sp. SG20118 TaxID=3367156 RepID=UPI0037DFC43F
MKSYIFIINVLLLISSVSVLSAQEKQNEDLFSQFEHSFVTNFKVPPQLHERCLPIVTIMSIKFDEYGNISALNFSDSAYPQFVQEVFRIKDSIQFRYLYEEISALGKQNENILIPIQINPGIVGVCASRVLQFDLLNLYLFNKKPLEGKYFLYKNITYFILKTRTIF